MSGAELVFDKEATRYDETFSYTSVGKLQRKRVWKFLSGISPKTHPHVLELNCGTGIDAGWFARKGFKITATDISTNMIGRTEERFRKNNLQGEFLQMNIVDAGRIFEGKKFDVIFSDFGGINCLSPAQIDAFAKSVSGLLRKGGKLVLVIMGRKCLWERFYFRQKKQPEKMNRRLSKAPVRAEINGDHLDTWYYSPEEIERAFLENFHATRLHPVGIFIPPSYLDKWFIKRKWLLEILEFCEKVFAFPILANAADHYFIELVKE
jgi:ubiquinone/menaquinone biosynthesis C-methylase UbiE